MKNTQKKAGIFMPISALPSQFGIGTLGKESYKFVDFLASARCAIWQVLPLSVTGFGNSPYQSCSSDAFNPYFIDLDMLYEEGLIGDSYRTVDFGGDEKRVDYGKMYNNRFAILREAYSKFNKTKKEYVAFLKEGRFDDFAVFMAIKQSMGGASIDMWGELSKYSKDKVKEFELANAQEIEFWKFTQFLFLLQWKKLKAYANKKGVKIMGDMPIYVSRDSVEYWKYKDELFLLDESGDMSMQAGVPPDYFSQTGQLWGNPIYDWEKMKLDGYSWWHRRIDKALSVFDIVRIDHFIGFVKYYCIPASEQTALVGEWRKGPGKTLFDGYEDKNIVAEDLGDLTDDVREAVKATGYPGMKIVQYAFNGDEKNEHKPSNYPQNLVAYTGTHDNDTLMSMIKKLTPYDRTVLIFDLKKECNKLNVRFRGNTDDALADCIIRLTLSSKANTVIIPYWDVIHCGEEARMNKPAIVGDENWTFRFTQKDFSLSTKRKLKSYLKKYDRIAKVSL